MRKNILIIFLILYLCLLVGCSIHPFRVATSDGKNLKDQPGLLLIDPNASNRLFTIEKTGDNNDVWNITWIAKGHINLDDKCRVKYLWPHHLITGKMVVEGQFGSNGTKYPIILDTGCSVACMVNDLHVIKNKMPIYPLGTNPVYSAEMGLCRLPELRIGKMSLTNLLSMYIEKRNSIQTFGVSIAYDDSILVGLDVLRSFRYILFDNINKEVEFSAKETFAPDESELWASYPFSIKEKTKSSSAIFVEIPVASEPMELMLDTGWGGELVLNEQNWEKLSRRISKVRLRKDNCAFAFLPEMACKKTIVKKLDIGHIKIKSAKIEVLPDDNPLKLRALLGMYCFRNTIMVLDFERNLMWIKKNGAH